MGLRHALDCAGTVQRALEPDAAERKRQLKVIKADLKPGKVRGAIAGLEPYRGRDPDVAAWIDHYKKNKDRPGPAFTAGHFPFLQSG